MNPDSLGPLFPQGLTAEVLVARCCVDKSTGLCLPSVLAFPSRGSTIAILAPRVRIFFTASISISYKQDSAWTYWDIPFTNGADDS